MLNQTVITGNLGEDPKEFFSPEGVPVTSFDLAFQAVKKKTCWIEWSHSISWRKSVQASSQRSTHSNFRPA